MEPLDMQMHWDFLTLKLNLRAWVCNFWDFDAVTTFNFNKYQTNESLTHLQALNSLSKCKVVMVKWDRNYRIKGQAGGGITPIQKRFIHDKPKDV